MLTESINIGDLVTRLQRWGADHGFTPIENWFNPPAAEEQIQAVEHFVLNRYPEDYRAYLLLTNGSPYDSERSLLLPWCPMPTNVALEQFPGWRNEFVHTYEHDNYEYRSAVVRGEHPGWQCSPQIRRDFFPVSRMPIGTRHNQYTMVDMAPSPLGTVGQVITWQCMSGDYVLRYLAPSFGSLLRSIVEWLETTNPPTNTYFPGISFVDYEDCEVTQLWRQPDYAPN
jgi:cell wall assembly regulator SMI1